MALEFCKVADVQAREEHWRDYFPEKVGDTQIETAITVLIQDKSEWLSSVLSSRYDCTGFDNDNNVNYWLKETTIVLVVYAMQLKKSKVTDEIDKERDEKLEQIDMIVKRIMKLPGATDDDLVEKDSFVTDAPADLDPEDCV